jgi:nonsense-mediated mRNA decay protein 3
MPHRFCAVCGLELDENAPHFGMCLKCYLEENPLFELPQSYNFKLCMDCQSYSKKEEWYESTEQELLPIIEEVIKRFLLKNYIKQGAITFSFSFDKLTYSSKNLLTSLDVIVVGYMSGINKLTHQQSIRILIDYELCKNCTNLRGGMYYLSIIQLRVKEKTQFDEIKATLDDISLLVENLFIKDNKQYIAKMEDQPLGVDLYLSTNELMNRIISHIRTKHYFILKRSKKLVGRDSQKGRNLYRLKALIKFLPIRKNDYILVNNSKLFIENITKNRVLLRNEKHDKTLIRKYMEEE